jgi:hypothetical protein
VDSGDCEDGRPRESVYGSGILRIDTAGINFALMVSGDSVRPNVLWSVGSGGT